MPSKSYGCDLRNVSKNFLKMNRKGQLWTFSSLFKNCPNDSNEKLYSRFFMMSDSYRCDGIEIVWLAFEKRSHKYTKYGKKTAVLFFFSFFSNTVLAVRTKVYTVFLHHIGVLYVQWQQSRIAGNREPNPKWPKKLPIVDFFICSKRGLNDSNEFFYGHSTPYVDSYMCNCTKIVSLRL